MTRFFAVLLSLSLSAAALSQARPAITGISHIAVYTSHPEAAEKYYVHDIGLFKATDPENPDGVRYYVNSTQFVGVLPLPAGQGPDRLDHLAYITSDAEAMRAYLAAQKVDVPAKVEHGSDGSLWFHVKDPEGNIVGFVQPPAQPVSISGSNPIGHHVIHVGMTVKSRDAEDAFYRSILGFRPYWYGGMKPDRTDWVSQQVPDGHDWLEYMLSPMPANATPDAMQKQLGVMNHLSIGVVNMEKAVTTLSSGDRLDNQHTPMQIGRDGKWQFNLFDPDQTRLELMEFSNVEKPCCSSFTAENPVPAE
jgi:catechol 2,3-dioxygenase-like lactoylglutathione lyase family enzyme